MTPKRILFLPDHGPRIGGGHAMRCLTLAQAATAAGARAAVAVTTEARRALRPFWPDAVEALEVQALLPQGPVAAEQWNADWAVVDHYRIEARYEAALRGGGRRIAAIDDLADRAHAADLVVDPSFGRQAGDYAALAPGAKVLAGPAYALLRPAFAEARQAALARRADPPRRILLAMGLTDLDGITARIARLILQTGEAQLEVAVGSNAPSLPDLRLLAASHPRLGLRVDAAGMAQLMCEADLAIGAGGSSVWERACLGLPSLTVILADNQAAQARALARAGAVLVADAADPAFEAVLTTQLDRLRAKPNLRAELSRTSAALCDGDGAGRVAKAILAF